MNYLYHVTKTKTVPTIIKNGLRPMPKTKSNWVVASNGKPYGRGYFFVFTHFEDAVRWAGKMDWDFNGELGSGEVSIVRLIAKGRWEADDSDPLSHVGHKGLWLRRKVPIRPEYIESAIPVSFEMLNESKSYNEYTKLVVAYA